MIMRDGDRTLRARTSGSGVGWIRYIGEGVDLLIAIQKDGSTGSQVIAGLSEERMTTGLEAVLASCRGSVHGMHGHVPHDQVDRIERIDACMTALLGALAETLPCSDHVQAAYGWTARGGAMSIGCDVPIGNPGRPRPGDAVAVMAADVRPGFVMVAKDHTPMNAAMTGGEGSHRAEAIEIVMTPWIERSVEMDVLSRLRTIEAGRIAARALGLGCDEILKK
jgi:hypothetical protein